MIRITETPFPLDAAGKKIGLPEPEATENVEVLEYLPDRPGDLDGGERCPRQQGTEALSETIKSFQLREEEYEQMIQALYDTGVVQVVRDKPKELNGLFVVPKKERKKKQLTLDARPENCQFLERKHTELPHPGFYAARQSQTRISYLESWKSTTSITPCAFQNIYKLSRVTTDIYRKRQRKEVVAISYPSNTVFSLSDSLSSHTRRAFVLRTVTERVRRVEIGELADRP